MTFIEILKDQRDSYGRWVARGWHAMLPEVRIDDFRTGSQLFALTSRRARLLMKDRRLWGKFRLQCVYNWMCYPEENYFPTLLSKADPQGCGHTTLTHVDWRRRSGGHAHKYEMAEVGPDLITRLRIQRPRYSDEEEGAFNCSNSSLATWRRIRHHAFSFAWKFGADTIKPLMSISSDVIRNDCVMMALL